jgi:hypothetical protein
MDFKVMSIKPNLHRRAGGWTLIELLTGMLVASIVLGALASLSIYSSRTLAGLFNYTEISHSSRLALDRMSREIRQTQNILSWTTNRLAFRDHDGAELAYVYSPGTKRLLRQKNGDEDVLLQNCDVLTFQVYKSNPVQGSFIQPLATNVNESKVVALNWACSRRVLGGIRTSEPVQSAKIVIRKK